MLETINGGKLPTKATKYSSSVDLYANETVTIRAGETKVVPLGVCIDLEQIKDISYDYYNEFGYFMKIHFFELKIRSSLSAKYGLIIANGVGEIDLDYPDEIGIIIHNPIKIIETKNMNWFEKLLYNMFNLYMFDSKPFTIKKGDRIAQIKLMEHKSNMMGFDSEDIRNGGYGSTGK